MNFHLINIIFVLDEYYISNIKFVTCSISTLDLDIRIDGWIARYIIDIDRPEGRHASIIIIILMVN